MIQITLPYPDKTLNPNVCKHFYLKAKVKAVARAVGYDLSKHLHGIFYDQAKLSLLLIVHRKDNRLYDLDNVLASSKAVLDGVFAGLGIDDSAIDKITIKRGNVDKLNPRVDIFISEIKS